MWIALVVVCVIGVLSITNPSAREMTRSAFWGVGQVINTLVRLMVAGGVGWIVEQRFAIATWVVLTGGAVIMALALLRSYRKAQGWQPQVRLLEWMELPRLAPPAAEPVVVPYALDGVNRRLAAAMAVAGAALLTWSVNLMIWTRDVLLPREARRLAHAATVGRVESRARLESLRDTALHLQFAARAWYAAAGAPAVQELATKATEAIRSAAAGGREVRMADINVPLTASSIGSYGPLRLHPAGKAEDEEEEQDVSRETDRLAS